MLTPQVSGVASHLTPVPGGVGPMTVAMLMYNTVQVKPAPTISLVTQCHVPFTLSSDYLVPSHLSPHHLAPREPCGPTRRPWPGSGSSPSSPSTLWRRSPPI